MKKTIKILLVFIGIMMLILGIGIYFLEKKTKSQIEEILSENFEPNLDSIDVNLSFFHRFPHPYLCVQNLKVNHHQEDTIVQILSVKDIDAEMNFWKLLMGDFEIKSVNFQDAYLLFYSDSLGNNIRLFKYKERDSTQKQGHFVLTLPKLHFENIHLIGQNDLKKSSWDLMIQNADFQGDVNSGLIDLSGEIEGVLNHFLQKGKPMFNNKPIQFKTGLEFDPFKKTTKIKSGNLNISSTEFDIEGMIQAAYPKGSELDLKLHAENEFNALFAFFPTEIQSQFQQINEAAQSKLNIQISGISGPKENPKMDVEMSVSDASIVSAEFGTTLDSLNIDLKYSNGDEKSPISSELIINDLYGKLKGNPIQLDLKYSNFDDPNIELDFDFELDLKDVIEFYQIPNVQKIGGSLDLKGHVRGRLNAENDFVTRLDGQLNFDKDDLILKSSNMSFKDLEGRIEIRDSMLVFKNLKGDFSNIPFTLTGEVENTYRLIRNNRRNLRFDLDIYSRSVNLNKILSEITNTGQKVNKGNHPLDLPRYLNGEIRLKTPKLKYREAIAQRFSSMILIRNSDIFIPKMYMDVLHGHLTMDVKLRKKDAKTFDLTSYISFSNLNTKRLLEIFNNFGQKVITSKQVEGRLSADIQLKAIVDNNLNLPSNHIGYVSEFSLKKAELIDFEPIVKALKHVKKKEAAHVKIENLKGKALYHQHQMYIPYLNFKSNLTTVSMFGNRKPSESLDFHVKLNLSELLFDSKKKRRNRKKKKVSGMEVRVNLTGKPGELKIKPRTKSSFEDLKRATNRAYTKLKRTEF